MKLEIHSNHYICPNFPEIFMEVRDNDDLTWNEPDALEFLDSFHPAVMGQKARYTWTGWQSIVGLIESNRHPLTHILNYGKFRLTT